MSEEAFKKYSKVSPALKCYFFQNLYYYCLSIKQAAQKCKINYSTAKIILRDLVPEEKKYIKRVVRRKEKDEREGIDFIKTCSYAEIFTEQHKPENQVEIVSRLGFDFFNSNDKKI